MKTYSSMRDQFVHGWDQTTESHLAGFRADFHYHDLDEWLEVVRGDITFFTLSGQAYRVGVGQALQIPRGEVHRVEVGPDVVDYRMWTPVPAGGNFSKELSPQEVALLQKNLEFPVREDAGDAPFFDRILSDRSMFCGVDGVVIDKKGFIGRGFVRRGRSSAGSVRVLNRTTESLLILTVVTVSGAGGPPQSFMNVRLFVQEDGEPKCRVWVNYREPA